jgi:hypothetical protein
LGCAHNCNKANWEGAVGLCTKHEEGNQAPKIADVCNNHWEVDEDGVGTPIPSALADVLSDFADQMPNELSKVLPPRHILDHCIELELGLQQLAKAPYQLSTPELEELKQQLTKLNNVGFI